jgi:DNA-binding XRE family transcriptional regulator
MKNNNIQTTNLSEISKDFNSDDWQQVAAEKRYYHLVTALRELRLEAGFTQKQLAKKSGIPRETVVMVESGKRNVTLETLMILGEAMGKKLKISFE